MAAFLRILMLVAFSINTWGASELPGKTEVLDSFEEKLKEAQALLDGPPLELLAAGRRNTSDLLDRLRSSRGNETSSVPSERLTDVSSQVSTCLRNILAAQMEVAHLRNGWSLALLTDARFHVVARQMLGEFTASARGRFANLIREADEARTRLAALRFEPGVAACESALLAMRRVETIVLPAAAKAIDPKSF